MGSGSLANEAVAAQLALLSGRGLVVTNGEFGERLAEQATRLHLNFEQLNFDWGLPLDYEQVSRKLKSKQWIWLAYCETSTGTLNNIPQIIDMCRAKKIKVCVDSVSAIGCVPVNFSEIYLASGTSGKGLGAFPGISFVLSNHCPASSCSIPKYLDIGYYQEKKLVPFTFSSNLLAALKAGAAKSLRTDNSKKIKTISAGIEKFMQAYGIKHANSTGQRAYYMLTMALGSGVPSEKLGKFLSARGLLVHYRNTYLLQRNWVQIALMGNVKIAESKKLIDAMQTFFEREKPAH